MAQKKPVKSTSQLSPENYIRKKARTLPVFECLINNDWEEAKMANLIVARRHTNGNITAGLYLVDLLCLGIKDTFWFFNIPEHEYREKLESFLKISEDEVGTIDYDLAHNIVFAGIGLAEELEFKPHKDFTAVTQYILEEDTDDVPIIEIECGIYGLPAYMQGTLHSEAKAHQVIAQLEKVVGVGNFYILDEEGIIINEDDFEDNNPYSSMDEESKRTEFENYLFKSEGFSEDDARNMAQLTQSLIDDLIDIDKYNGYSDEFYEELSAINVNVDEIPDEMLGVEPDAGLLTSEVKHQFVDLLRFNGETEDLKKHLDTFRKNQGVEAASSFLELHIKESEDPEGQLLLLNTLAEKFPHCSLLQIKWAETNFAQRPELGHYKYESFFKDRESIHPIEFFSFLQFRSMCIIKEDDLEKLEAWKDTLEDFISVEDYTVLQGYIFIFQIRQVAGKLNIAQE